MYSLAKRCVFAYLNTWLINNRLYIRLKLAGFSHILTEFMDAQRRTALIFVTQDVGCALIQHCFKVLCLNKIATVILIVAFKRFQLSIPNTQYWFNTGPLSGTLAQN